MSDSRKNISQSLNHQQSKSDIEIMIIELLNIYMEIVSFFECSKCGQCCQKSPNLLFSDEITEFDKDVIYQKDGLYGIKDPCPFFVDNICKIHETVKPRICRFAPFVIGNRIDQIILTNCELGKKVSDEYNTFIEESNIDIRNMVNPFANVEIMNVFLDWLKNRRYKHGKLHYVSWPKKMV